MSARRHPRSPSPPTCCPATDASARGRPRSAPEAVEALAKAASPTTWAPATARRPSASSSSALRNGLAELLTLPDGYEIMLGNGGHDRVLGRRRVRAHRAPQPAPELRRVLLQVRGRGRRRAVPRRPSSHRVRLRARIRSRSPTRTSTSTASPTTRPRPAWRCRCTARTVPIRRCTRARRRHLGRRRACASIASQVDVYYFAPQKCLGSDGGLWLAAMSPGCDRAHRAHRSVRPLDPGVHRPVDRPRQQPQGPDVQHAGAGHAVPRRRAGRVDQRQRRPRVGGVALRPVGRDPLRLGRGVELRDAVRRRPGAAQPRGRPPSTSTRRSTPQRCPQSCGATASSTPSRTASSAATSCASRCSLRSTRTTSPRSRSASTTSSDALG